MPAPGVDDRRRRGRQQSLRCALKWSNGSRQASHTHSDLHAVDPNRDSSRVSGRPHCGQRTDSVTRDRPAGDARASGGAMPYSRSAAPALARSSSRSSRPATARCAPRPRRTRRRARASSTSRRIDVHRRAAGVGRRDRDDDACRRRRRRRRAGRRGRRWSAPAPRGRAPPPATVPRVVDRRARGHHVAPGCDAVQVLHLGEQVAQRLGVDAAPAAAGRRAQSPPAGSSVASASTGRRTPSHSGAQRRRVDGDALGDERLLEVVGARTARRRRARSARARPASGGATPRCRRRAAAPTGSRGRGGSRPP